MAVWVARQDIIKRGYPVKSVRLWPPTADTRQAFTPAIAKYIASECTRLQTEMLAWSRGGDGAAVVFDGTLNGLIRCYQHDPDSDYLNLRHKSKKSYCDHLAVIERTVGQSTLSAIKGRHLRQWFTKWAEPKITDGPRRVALAHAAITMMRIITGFGVAILEDGECLRLNTILSNMQFENPKRRVAEITADQAVAVRQKAHELGFPSIALAQALAFELATRQKDCIGEWLPVEEPGLSSIMSRGEKWLYGFDWREVDGTTLTHRLSKSLKGRTAVVDPNAGKVKRWDLALYPMIVEELAHVPAARRIGPMIIDERTSLPYRTRTFSDRWRAIATAAGVPKNVQNRDSRAGGVTETIEATGSLEQARIAAGHSDIKTTQIYSRGDDRRTAAVAVLRAKGRKTDAERG